jgi:hypothetical protein
MIRCTSRVIRVGFSGLKLGVAAVGGVIFTMAGSVQSATADLIYHLEAGAEYSVTSGVGTFIIPSVAEGLLFYLDVDDPPTEITLTGLYHSDDKVRCIAITQSTYACSTEGTSLADSGDGHGWQSDGQGSTGNDPLGHGSNENDPTNSLVRHHHATRRGSARSSDNMANQLNAQEAARNSGGGMGGAPAPAMGGAPAPAYGGPRTAPYGQPNQLYGIPGAGQPSASTPVAR